VQFPIQRRLSAPRHASHVYEARPSKALDAFITKHFDESASGRRDASGKLRSRMAGKGGLFPGTMQSTTTFSPAGGRYCSPIICYVAIEAFVIDLGWHLKLLIVSIAALLAIPRQTASARRQRCRAHAAALAGVSESTGFLVVCR